MKTDTTSPVRCWLVGFYLLNTLSGGLGLVTLTPNNMYLTIVKTEDVKIEYPSHKQFLRPFRILCTVESTGHKAMKRQFLPVGGDEADKETTNE